MDLTNKVELEEYFADHFDTVLFPVLADLYLREKDYSRALKVCEIGLGYHPAHMDGLYTQACVLVALGRLEEAEKSLLALKETGLYHAHGMELLVDVQRRLRRAASARIKTWEFIIRHRPRHPRAAANIRRLKKKIAEGPRRPAPKRKKSTVKKQALDRDVSLKDVSQVTAIREETAPSEQENWETPPSFQSTRSAEEIDIPEDVFNQPPEATKTSNDTADGPETGEMTRPEPDSTGGESATGLSFVDETGDDESKLTDEPATELVTEEFPETGITAEDSEPGATPEKDHDKETDFTDTAAAESESAESELEENKLKFAPEEETDAEKPEDEPVISGVGETGDESEELVFTEGPDTPAEEIPDTIESDPVSEEALTGELEPDRSAGKPPSQEAQGEEEDPVTKFLTQDLEPEPEDQEPQPEEEAETLAFAEEPESVSEDTGEPEPDRSAEFTEPAEDTDETGSSDFKIKPLPEKGPSDSEEPDSDGKKSDRPLIDLKRAPHILLEKPENFPMSSDKPLKLNPRMATFTMVSVLYKQGLHHQALQVLDVLEKKGEDPYRIKMERKRIREALKQDAGN